MKIKFLLSIFIVLSMIGLALFFVTSKNVSTSRVISQPSVAKAPLATVIQMVPPVAVIQKSEIAQVPLIKKTAVSPFADNKNSRWIDSEVNAIKPQAENINVNVLKLSLTAYQKAQKRGLTSKPLLTIIDYSKPSTERRLWVVDLEKRKVLFNTLVAHGKNSGAANSSSFSNRNSSLKSSIGVFVTSDIYSGKHGSSLRVQGLESGVNDHAYSRSIVFHGAKYVSPSIAKRNGMIGRSWGCMAVSQDVISPLINTIKNKSLVFAYYPDQKWLSHSSYLT